MRAPPQSITRVASGCALAALLLASIGAATARADDPRGPGFGRSRAFSEIRSIRGEEDVDDYVQALVEGETVQVVVSAARKSALQPTIELIGPDGQTRAAKIVRARSGRAVTLRRFKTDETGLWTVRIAGDGGSEGAYVARFVTAGRIRYRQRKLALDGDQPRGSIQFAAVGGAQVTAVVSPARRSPTVRIVGIDDPDGEPVPGVVSAAKQRGTRSTLTRHQLVGGAGTYTLKLALGDDGEATYGVDIRLAADPSRPRGRYEVNPDEPWIEPRSIPITAFPKAVFTLTGENLRAPLPDVYFDGVKVSVLAVLTPGRALSVIAPDFPPDTLSRVEVVDAFGQGNARDAYFLFDDPGDIPPPPPPPPDPVILALEPDGVTVQGGEKQTFRLTIDGDAPFGGIDVALSTSGGIGTVPPAVTVEEGSTEAVFQLTAGNIDASGLVTATLGGSVDVSVVVEKQDDPPANLDISGYIVHQANSTRTIQIPANTTLSEGDYIVIGRNATKAQFEAHWGVTLGANVTYLNSVSEAVTVSGTPSSGGEFPTINGKQGKDATGETYRIANLSGGTVDGGTIPMANSGGQNLQRKSADAAAGVGASWAIATPGPSATPGSGMTVTGNRAGLVVSEFSDATGSGNYVYEFVELYLDG